MAARKTTLDFQSEWLKLFLIYKSPHISYTVSNQLAFPEKKFQIDFQDGECGGHIWFPIRTILVIFDLQVT